MRRTSLAETVRRLAALDPDAGFDLCPPSGEGWLPLAEAAGDEALDGWLAVLVDQHGRRNVAGSVLAYHLGSAVILPTVGAMVLDGVCPDPAVGNLAIRVDGDGNVERVAVRTLAVAPVADDAALRVWWARRAVATITPLLAAVGARAPFSARNLWGVVADQVTSTALWIGQLAGLGPGAAWARAEGLAAAFTGAAPTAVRAGRPFPVRERMFQVGGTCCLNYRSVLESGPPAETYCDTCPLRDDESRRRRLEEYLDSTAA
ncbi:hypothetical protein GCM10010112_84110 [Actinoplanes lobatus]|uniref:Ferric siderophore reductase C-terminal domain-containing protein n=1 Tax=Actinoplanes lobatus TaxID=113568 RepID=A0A7W7HIG4_9ACTN|nr:(2Fe-2S)-binding protein [Actinoplanes lobatus]MBB4751149.1 hypothetical protein [Actinoplanes lobatus]GGN94592.1 hypothetical protein GCM10010112_84110 [Actinoplanes lobatus]GIE44645.1 hypothetical protein Alo02nite_75430 [Actinoplanes lobatus]